MSLFWETEASKVTLMGANAKAWHFWLFFHSKICWKNTTLTDLTNWKKLSFIQNVLDVLSSYLFGLGASIETILLIHSV